MRAGFHPSLAEEIMSQQTVCPYYGCDEELCDVGCGYISPHDAKMIIKFCSSQFCECHKYLELADRLGEQRPVSAPAPWTVPTATPQTLPAPAFALFCFAVCVGLFAVHQLPIPQPGVHTMALCMMLAAMGQIVNGLTALKSNPLRAVAFTGFGLFWLSIVAIALLPGAGYGALLGPLPLAGYQAIWGVFCLVLAQGTDNLTRACRVTFAMLAAFLFLLSLGHVTNSTTLIHSAALVGFACSLPGLLGGACQGWRELLAVVQPGTVQASRVRR
jgi:succinate-acetate transporter protein